VSSQPDQATLGSINAIAGFCIVSLVTLWSLGDFSASQGRPQHVARTYKDAHGWMLVSSQNTDADTGRVGVAGVHGGG
jgi:hypothetical protein